MILVVLLQPGNKGGAAAALGGAGSDTVFGARGANTFLSKLTFSAAVCFMLTNFALSFLASTNDKSSVIRSLESKENVEEKKEAPKEDAKPQDPEAPKEN